jgi:hypothetical protein
LVFVDEQIADDADLDQARRALRTAQTFFNALMNDADVACLYVLT